MQCHQTNTTTYDIPKGQLSLGDCGSTLHTPPSTPGIIAATSSNSRHRKPVQGFAGTIRPRGLKPFRPPSCRGVKSPLAPSPEVGFSTDLRWGQNRPSRTPEAPPGLPGARRTPSGPSGTTPKMTVLAGGLKPFRAKPAMSVYHNVSQLLVKRVYIRLIGHEQLCVNVNVPY